MRSRRSILSAWVRWNGSLLLALCAAAVLPAPSQAQTGTTYAYDELGRVISVTYPDATTVDYGYDPAGNRTITYANAASESAPAFSVNDVSVTEGGSLVFTVTKSATTTLPYAVSYTTTNGTAAAGADYGPVSGTLTFAGGETTKAVTVVTTQDTPYETGETVLLALSLATNGATISDSQGVGTITNDDPTFSVNDVTVAEGGNLVFTVTKTGATSLSHDVSYATANGTAAAGSDYTSASGTLTFASGDATKTVTVATSQEAIYELGETVLLNLSSATNGATISDAQGSGTISNDDAGPAFSVDDVAVLEGGNLVFTVTKTGGTSQSHDVSYATANGTASGADYTSASGTLSFASGDTTKTVTVTTTQDAPYEANETVLLNLSSATNGATISDSQGSGAINDDDGAPTFSVNDVSVTEGGNLVFTVTKTGATAQSHDVSYATASGTATSGTDFTGASGTLTFATSDTTKTVTVATASEAVYEANETVLLNLSGATGGATISDNQGSGAINNDDSAPAFSVNDVSVAEGGNLVFTVTKTGSTSFSHAVNYATANGTASSGDYTAASSSLTFASGDATKTVTVATVQDSAYEPSETVLLNLSSATNGASISDSQGSGSITNDGDGSPPYANSSGPYICQSVPYPQWYVADHYCVDVTAYDPDGGTAYIDSAGVTYTTSATISIGYIYYNLFFPEYYEWHLAAGGSVWIYLHDTTGQNANVNVY